MVSPIRPAVEGDAPGMLAIYAPLVRETAVSFELEPPSQEEFRRRIRENLRFAPWLVWEEGSRILGYVYASRFRPRPAYQWTAEVTAYVHPEARGRGVGSALYRELFERLRRQGFYGAVAVITVPNRASIRLHQKLGFRPVGIFRRVGYKLGAWHDVAWWELTLQERPARPEPPRPPGEGLPA